MKKIKKAFVLLVTLFFVLYFSLGFIVKRGIQKVGPMLTKTDVDVSLVTVSPLTGKAVLHGFKLGNMKGYSSPVAISVGTFKVRLKPSSLVRKVIRIQEVVIDKPKIFYETNSAGNNLIRIQANVESFSPSSISSDQNAQKKVIIDRLVIKNGTIHWKTDFSLPDIELKDIGAASGGVNMSEAVSQVMRSLTGGLASGIANAGKNVAGQAQGAVNSLQGLFKR